MNENLTDKVVEWVGQTAQQIGDFAAKEVPPFITEYLQWKFWESVANIGFYAFWLSITLICITIVTKVFFYCSKKYDEGGEDRNSWEFIGQGCVFLDICLFIAFVLQFLLIFPKQDIVDCMKIKMAPKVYLVEKATEIYKEAKEDKH